MSTFVPSENQQNFFDFVQTGRGSCVLIAVAGSGKTTTVVHSVSLIPEGQKVLLLAFNKKIAKELETRIPSHARAGTFHARGFAAWSRFRNRKVAAPDSGKMRKLLRKHFSMRDQEDFGTAALKLVAAAKSTGVGKILPNETRTWFDLASHFEIELSEIEFIRERTIVAAQQLLKHSVDAAMAEMSEIDFDDMLYMPLIKDVEFERFDWLFIDEAQDTNDVQLHLIPRMLSRMGRLVAVGDPKQAIYGFRGAGTNAIAQIKAKFDAKEMPLTVSYRCSRAVVAEAQKLVPYIESAASAPMGEVFRNYPMHAAGYLPTDAILCRNTAPLISYAFDLISRGTACVVLGREIGKSLVDLIERMKAYSMEDLLARLEEYRAREVSALIAADKEEKADAINDRVQCVKAIINALPETERTLADVVSRIESLFADDQTNVLTLCTVHKSKGLEWDRVFILRPELMPSKWARNEWQRDQEQNLRYVAITRAKRTLIFLSEFVTQIPQKETNPVLSRFMRDCADVFPSHDDFWSCDNPTVINEQSAAQTA